MRNKICFILKVFGISYVALLLLYHYYYEIENELAILGLFNRFSVSERAVQR